MKLFTLAAAAVCAFSVTASPVPEPASNDLEKRDWLRVTVWDNHDDPFAAVQDLYFGSNPCLILDDNWKNKISQLEVRGGSQCQHFQYEANCDNRGYGQYDAGFHDLAKEPDLDNHILAIKCYAV